MPDARVGTSPFRSKSTTSTHAQRDTSVERQAPSTVTALIQFEEGLGSGRALAGRLD